MAEAKTHDLWQSRVLNARRRLNRDTKESEWARWAKLSDIEDYKRLSFTEAARRDIKLDVVGERPVIKVEAYKISDQASEQPQTRLAEIELDRAENWDAVTRVVEDTSIAGIGWLRADWYIEGEMPAMPESTNEQDTEQVSRANQHVAAILAGQPAEIADDDDHAIHVRIEGASLNDFGMNPQQRGMLHAHVREHQDLMPALPPAGFRMSRVHPSNIVYDETADEWRYVRWVAERSIQTLEEVQGNKSFSNTSQLKGKEEIRRRGYRRGSRRRGVRYRGDSYLVTGGVAGEEEKFEILWYIHDIENEKLIVIAEDNPAKKPLLEADWPYDGPIYYPLVFDRETDGIEGISDYRKINYPCSLREEIQTRWIEHLRLHSRRKILLLEGMLDNKGRGQLEDPDQTIVEAKNLNGINVLDRVDINRDAYQVDTVMAENVNRMLGSSDVHQGVGKSSGSATEASILDASRGRVVRDRRKKVASMLVWAIRRMFNYYKMFGTQPLFLARGVGPVSGVILDPDDISEEVWVTVDNDTLSAANAELNRNLIRQAVEVITASQWMMEGLGEKGRMEVLRQFLRSQKIINDPDTILNEAKLEQQARAEMQAELARLAAPGMGTPGAPGAPQPAPRGVEGGGATPGGMTGGQMTSALQVSPGEAAEIRGTPMMAGRPPMVGG